MPTVTKTIAVGADDYHSNAEGSFVGTFGQVSTGTIASGNSDLQGAVRWAGLSIPKGAVISSATMDTYFNEAPSSAFTMELFLEAAINPAASTDAAEMRARALTAAKAEWPLTTQNGAQTTPDFKAALQEQVNKADLTAFIIRTRNKNRTNTATSQYVRFNSFENASGLAAKLTITYEVPYTASGSASASTKTASGTGTSANPPTTASGGAPARQKTATGTGASTNPAFTGAGSAAGPERTATGTGDTMSDPPFVASGGAQAPERSAEGTGLTDNPPVTAEGGATRSAPTAEGRGVILPPDESEALTVSPQSELTNAVARYMFGLLPPGRKPKEGGRAWFTVLALSALLADADQAVIQMVLDWSPSQTQRDDLLALIGQARGVRRGAGEPFEAYRARVVNAADFWKLGGTVPGVIKALETAGYKVKVIEHYLTDRTRWAEFSIELYPDRTDFTGDTWDDDEGYWNDGTRWDWVLSPTEGERIKDIIRETKAAHSKVRSVTYQHGGPPDYWDDDTGSWDDDSSWRGFDPIQIL